MNPYAIIAILVAFAASNAGSYFYGQHTQENADKAAQVDAIHQAILDYDAIAQQDKDTAVRQASQRAAQSQRSADIRNKSDEAIRNQPLPVSCDWSDESFRLLVDAVNNAANNPPAQPGVPNAMPANKPTSKPQR